MSAIQTIETKLDEIFVKNAPALPTNGKKALVKYLPWINLVLGLLTLYSAYLLWHWAHYANALINYANSYGALYGGPTISTDRMNFGLWLALVFLIIESVIYLAAFPATRKRQKRGWDLMFYAVLVNIVYAVIVAFTRYGGVGSLLFGLIGVAIGLYLLFQIRASYLKLGSGKKA